MNHILYFVIIPTKSPINVWLTLILLNIGQRINDIVVVAIVVLFNYHNDK